MRVSDMFPSKYLKADDLQNRPINVVIDKVVEDEIDGDNGSERKFVVYFQRAEKGLVLNKTNAHSIAQICGDDTADWPGYTIELYPAMVQFQGRATPCIRVRFASGQTVASQQQVPQQSYADRRNPPDPALQGPASIHSPAVAGLDDEIPF